MRQRINETNQFIHPDNPAINGCSHILWTDVTIDKTSTARNAAFYGDKAIDRSPCGTGTSARMAQWYGKGKLKKPIILLPYVLILWINLKKLNHHQNSLNKRAGSKKITLLRRVNKI